MRPRGSRIVFLAAALCMADAAVAYGGPCTPQITKVERQIRRLAPGPDTGPTAPQSIGAQLHHQPTPNSVQNAESKALTDAEAALDRARRADSAGDLAACTKALKDAKEVFGLE
jgi:hypothetical protein